MRFKRDECDLFFGPAEQDALFVPAPQEANSILYTPQASHVNEEPRRGVHVQMTKPSTKRVARPVSNPPTPQIPELDRSAPDTWAPEFPLFGPPLFRRRGRTIPSRLALRTIDTDEILAAAAAGGGRGGLRHHLRLVEEHELVQ